MANRREEPSCFEEAGHEFLKELGLQVPAHPLGPMPSWEHERLKGSRSSKVVPGYRVQELRRTGQLRIAFSSAAVSPQPPTPNPEPFPRDQDLVGLPHLPRRRRKNDLRPGVFENPPRHRRLGRI